MATVIRLKRGGRVNAPYYRIVVMNRATRDRGRVIEELGVYHPCARPAPRVTVNKQNAYDWLAKGAQPSPTVRKIMSKAGLMAALAAKQRPDAGEETAVEVPEGVPGVGGSTLEAAESVTAGAEEVAPAETPAEETAEETAEA